MTESPPSHSASPGSDKKFPCPRCHANLAFCPENGVIACPYCGWKDQLPRDAAHIQEHSYEQYLHIEPANLKKLGEQALEVACGGCGAVVDFVPPDIAGTCSFCGAAIVAEPKQADPVVAPHAILPFRLSSNEASAAIRRWISSLWFAPNALKQFAFTKSVAGVYLPFWTYDSNTESFYRGERGDYYYVTETYYERGIRKSRNVRHTRWSSSQGHVSRWFDDVIIPASISIPDKYLRALEPWDLGLLQEYDEKILAGFRAQRSQIDFKSAFSLAKQVMDQRIRTDVCRDIGGDEQRIHSLDTHYSAITFKHIMMPVYVGAFIFRGKTFQVVVNARTGEVQGGRPYSWIKIIFTVLAVVAIVILMMYFSAQFP